jgi:hypothetical protein
MQYISAYVFPETSTTEYDATDVEARGQSWSANSTEMENGRTDDDDEELTVTEEQPEGQSGDTLVAAYKHKLYSERNNLESALISFYSISHSDARKRYVSSCHFGHIRGGQVCNLYSNSLLYAQAMQELEEPLWNSSYFVNEAIHRCEPLSTGLLPPPGSMLLDWCTFLLDDCHKPEQPPSAPTFEEAILRDEVKQALRYMPYDTFAEVSGMLSEYSETFTSEIERINNIYNAVALSYASQFEDTCSSFSKHVSSHLHTYQEVETDLGVYRPERQVILGWTTTILTMYEQILLNWETVFNMNDEYALVRKGYLTTTGDFPYVVPFPEVFVMNVCKLPALNAMLQDHLRSHLIFMLQKLRDARVPVFLHSDWREHILSDFIFDEVELLLRGEESVDVLFLRGKKTPSSDRRYSC